MGIRWQRIAVLSAPHEVELARQRLQSQGIPVYVKGGQVGIFGPGFAGPSLLGLTMLVPSDRVFEARELVAEMVEAFGGELVEDDA